MASIARDLDHSRRRARLRDRVLLVLAERRLTTIGELSHLTRIRPARVQGILEGDGREYAFDLSLLGQGAARVAQTWPVRWFAITPLGEAEAKRYVR
jgi:predicted transcriptional regulator with HTH domain